MENKFFEPLQVNLTGEIRHHYDENSVLPAHELVIRPLLENSLDIFVYKGTKEEFFLCGKMQIPIKLEQEDILISDKGKFKFDKTKECIIGHEYLWNATMWKRGSIVFVLEPNKMNFAEIFKNTCRPSFEGTPNSGNTISAIKKCKLEMEKGNIAAILPASNGIEWIQIYVKGEVWENLVKSARNNCKEVNYWGNF